MRKGAYVKIQTAILDDRRFHEMPANEFRDWIMSLFDDPKNIYYETGSLRKGWASVREERKKQVYERDPHYCNYCGSKKHLEIDHVKPLARGGTHELSNLQILCRKCNRKKAASWES